MFVAYLDITNINNLQTNTLKHKYKEQTSCIHTLIPSVKLSIIHITAANFPVLDYQDALS